MSSEVTGMLELSPITKSKLNKVSIYTIFKKRRVDKLITLRITVERMMLLIHGVTVIFNFLNVLFNCSFQCTD